MASPSSAACPPANFAISRPTRTVAPAPLARASAAPRFALGGPRAVAKPTGAERFLRARGGQASTSGRSHHVAASAGPASPCLRRRATRCHVRTRGASGDCDARPSSRAERAAESAPEEDGTSPPRPPSRTPHPLHHPRRASHRIARGGHGFASKRLQPHRHVLGRHSRRGAAQRALMHNAFALWIIQLACTVVATGLQARVSSLVGAGDDAAVSRAVVQGLWGAAATYLLLLLVSPFVPALYASGIGIEPGTPACAHGAAPPRAPRRLSRRSRRQRPRSRLSRTRKNTSRPPRHNRIRRARRRPGPRADVRLGSLPSPRGRRRRRGCLCRLCLCRRVTRARVRCGDRAASRSNGRRRICPRLPEWFAWDSRSRPTGWCSRSCTSP